jgi:hypothetical protein
LVNRPRDSDSALRRRLNRYASPHVLVIDEVGYLSYSNRQADLRNMFNLTARKSELKDGAFALAQSRPPCVSTIERQIDRPMPKPFSFVL